MAYYRAACTFLGTKCTGRIGWAGTLRRQNALTLLGSASLLKLKTNTTAIQSSLQQTQPMGFSHSMKIQFISRNYVIQGDWDIGVVV